MLLISLEGQKEALIEGYKADFNKYSFSESEMREFSKTVEERLKNKAEITFFIFI